MTMIFVHSDPRIPQGWNIVQRMLTDPDLSLPRARKEVQELFGNDHENDIWFMLNQINDLDPDEFEASRGDIMAEVEKKIRHIEQLLEAGKDEIMAEVEQDIHFSIAEQLVDADVEMGCPLAPRGGEEAQSEGAESEGRATDLDGPTGLKRLLDEETLLAQWAVQSADDVINPSDLQLFSVACRVSNFLFFIKFRSVFNWHSSGVVSSTHSIRSLQTLKPTESTSTCYIVYSSLAIQDAYTFKSTVCCPNIQSLLRICELYPAFYIELPFELASLAKTHGLGRMKK